MEEYLTVWKTREVTIEIQVIGEHLILERTRGYKQKKKSIALKLENFLSLVEAVAHATTQQPTKQLQDRVLVGMVDGGHELLILEWGPYYFNTCNALMIRGSVGHCIAIEQQNVLSFVLWLAQQAIVVHSLSKLKTAE